MGFSNVPGPRENWKLAGKKLLVHGFSMPLGRTVTLGWGVLSHGDAISILCCADKACVKDIDAMMAQFETNLDEFLGSKDWRKFSALEEGKKKK